MDRGTKIPAGLRAAYDGRHTQGETSGAEVLAHQLAGLRMTRPEGVTSGSGSWWAA